MWGYSSPNRHTKQHPRAAENYSAPESILQDAQGRRSLWPFLVVMAKLPKKKSHRVVTNQSTSGLDQIYTEVLEGDTKRLHGAQGLQTS
ncbi:unnamed protein product [Caretta caretta]